MSKMNQLLLTVSVSLLLVSTAAAQGTAFTYQGKLTDSGNLANGNYDLQFALFDALSGGTQQGTTQTVSNVTVTGGIFTVNLDFGACSSCFNGSARFLEIAVRPSGGGSFTTLSPRQPVTSTPYAINAAQLGGLAASGYLQNSTSQQASSNFNISGNGTAGGTLTGSILNAVQQVNINGLRAFTVNGAYNFSGRVFTASNTFTGDGAGVNTTPSGTLNDGTGKFNSFYGAGAGQTNTTACCNAFFGAQSGQQNTTGGGNAFFGIFTGQANTTGSNNAFFGPFAGRDNTTGFDNTFFGDSAGEANTTGTNNTFIGARADFLTIAATGDLNTLLGVDTSVNSGVSNGTAIGANAAVTQSNSLVLGSVIGVNGAIFGTNVGIGTTAPLARLHVNGGTSFFQGDSTPLPATAGKGLALGFAPGGTVGYIFAFDYSTSQAYNLALNHPGGRVGIGTTTPARTLHVNGRAQINSIPLEASVAQVCFNNAGDLLQCGASSLRFKTNVQPFADGLNLLRRLRPISFDWKEGGTHDIGLAAEEVAAVAPFFTFKDEQGRVSGVKYERLSLLFINAFHEQQAQVENLQQQVSEQQQIIQQQKKQVEALKRLVCKSNPDEEICKP